MKLGIELFLYYICYRNQVKTTLLVVYIIFYLKIYYHVKEINFIQFHSISFNFIQFHSILTILLFSLLISCSPENVAEQANEASLENKRQTINQLGSNAVVKEAFAKLSPEEQKGVWISKFEQVKSRNLSKAHTAYLKEVIVLVKEIKNDKDVYNAQIEQVLLEVLKITPREDFIQMFMSLSDYTGNFDIKNVEVCQECIVKLKNEFQNGRSPIVLNKTQTDPAPPKLQNCDCEWTCGWGAGETTTDCKPTERGCGWLNKSPCGKTDSLNPK